MMKSVTTGLGLLTALAVAAATTPSGQAVLGMQPRHENPAITVVKDAPPPAPQAVRRQTPARAVPRAAVVRRRASSVAAPASPHAAVPAPAQPRALPEGLPQFGNIAKILLNLPPVLSQTQVRPSPPGAGNSWNRPQPWSSTSPGRQNGPADEGGQSH